MKKIIYFGHDVEIGNMIEIKGLRCEITQQLVDDNPSYFKVEDQPMYFKCVKGEGEYNKGRIYKQVDSTRYPEVINPISERGYDLAIYDWQSDYIKESRKCFELTTKAEWDMQELLDKAKRDYPAGTMINSRYGMQEVLSVEPFMGRKGIIQINTDLFLGGAIIYTPEDGWAEVLPIKFTTEDGVSIYGDMRTYFVRPSDTCDIDYYHSLWRGNSETNFSKYFYHKENALAYIKKHKEKTLKDYENILHTNKKLLDYSSYYDGASYNVSVGVFFHLLKANEPKLYYTKILQLIADHLNDGWVADFSKDGTKWFIREEDFEWTRWRNHGAVPFKTKELAEKARSILGDKVKYLFK